MSVRIKTLIIICLTFQALLGILYFTSEWFLLRGTIIAEEKSTTRDVTRLKAALDDEIAVMDATVGERSQRSEPGVGGEDDHRAVGSGDSLPPSRRFAGAGMKL